MNARSAQQITNGRQTAMFLLASCAVLGWASSHPEQANAVQERKVAKPTFNAAGELARPVGYREWVYVGTPVTPNDLNPPEAAFPEFHNVYIHPGDYAHYQRTGRFREGTILVKELVSVHSTHAASGNGYFMGEFIGLEATVKDAGRFPKEPKNWAYFSFGHVPEAQYAKKTSALPTATCAACHLENAAEDMVFSQYYPVLRAAKAASRGGP